MTEPLDAELLKDLRGLGKPPSFDGNDAHSLSTVDGQVRNRAESDLPGSSEIAGRCTPEVLHTDVLFVGFEDEMLCPNSCPIC